MFATLGVGGAAVLGGALLAPMVHGALVSLGRDHVSLAGLRDLSFERVVSRMVLILMVLGMVSALSWGRVCRPAELGLPRFRIGRRGLAVSFGCGLFTIVPVLFAGWGLGVYRVHTDPRLLAALAFLPAAFLVAGIEEALFRGALYRSVRSIGGVWGAAIFSSVLFSAVHFATPEPTVGIAHAHWYSGLQLLPDTFRKIHAGYHYFPLMLTLFLMGLVLCRVVEQTGSLYAAIGLHAGWIWALRVGDLLLWQEPERLTPLFGWDNRLATGYAATLLMALMILGLAVRQRPFRVGSA